MREILFRGKRYDKRKEWVVGNLYVERYRNVEGYGDFDKCAIGVAESGRPWQTAVYEVLTETVGQFTGLTDKNSKKIFEGDIVKVVDSPFGYSYIGVACFHEGSFCIQYTYWNKKRFHRIGQTDKWQDMGASGTVTYKYEVVGNIHDNPELIGRTDNA